MQVTTTHLVCIPICEVAQQIRHFDRMLFQCWHVSQMISFHFISISKEVNNLLGISFVFNTIVS